MSELHVDTDVLLQHSTRLAVVRDQLGLAADAAGQVNLHDGAFGLLCAFLPAVIGGFEGSTGDAIGASRETTTSMSDEVRAMARDYVRVDEGVASRMAALGEGAA